MKNKTTKTLYALALAILLAGCSQQDSDSTLKRRGEARAAAFAGCLELAAKITRQSDDDVADIVKACASASYHTTNYIK
jgi:uncharacterized lipoprotein YajG